MEHTWDDMEWQCCVINQHDPTDICGYPIEQNFLIVVFSLFNLRNKAYCECSILCSNKENIAIRKQWVIVVPLLGHALIPQL